jgi:endo-1,4-beta-xylanase
MQNNISTHIAGRTLFITGVTATNSTKIDVFDMQGRPIFSTENSKGVFDLSPIADGLYVVRVRSGSASLVTRISIR